MDPLSITAATIGISGATIASIASVRNTVNNIQDADEVVGDIRTQLESIQRPLDSLKELRITDTGTLTASKEALARSGVAEAVNDCGKACAAFDKKLQKWTKHSPEGKLSFRDKMTVGVWNKEKVITFKTRVETCQLSMQFAVSSVQLLVYPCLLYSRTPLTRRKHSPAETDEPIGRWLRAAEPANAEPRAPSK
jgi:N-methylhydantoinase B/oxoprolinase/acetone carboxylase alpha subunit